LSQLALQIPRKIPIHLVMNDIREMKRKEQQEENTFRKIRLINVTIPTSNKTWRINEKLRKFGAKYIQQKSVLVMWRVPENSKVFQLLRRNKIPFRTKVAGGRERELRTVKARSLDLFIPGNNKTWENRGALRQFGAMWDHKKKGYTLLSVLEDGDEISFFKSVGISFQSKER